MQFLLELLALGTLLSAALMITAKSPVGSVLCLIAVFLNAAGALALLGAEFLGLAYVIVYVGAVAILFLFVVMMLDLRAEELLEVGRRYRRSLPLAALIAALYFSNVSGSNAIGHSLEGRGPSVLSLLNRANSLSALPESSGPLLGAPLAQPVPHLQVEMLGAAIYGPLAPWLLPAALILLLAMLGPIILCLEKNDR
jgi:NADH-ubiquinone oxidoreductase chain 6